MCSSISVACERMHERVGMHEASCQSLLATEVAPHLRQGMLEAGVLRKIYSRDVDGLGHGRRVLAFREWENVQWSQSVTCPRMRVLIRKPYIDCIEPLSQGPQGTLDKKVRN